MPGENGQTAADYIKAEAERKLAEANDIAQKAANASRSITTEERKQVEGLLEEVSSFKVKLEDMKSSAALTETIDQMNASFNAPVAPAPESASTMGEAVVLSDQFRALREKGFSGKWTTGPIELKGMDLNNLSMTPHGFKANVTETLSPIVVPQYQPGIVETLLRRLTVQALSGFGFNRLEPGDVRPGDDGDERGSGNAGSRREARVGDRPRAGQRTGPQGRHLPARL